MEINKPPDYSPLEAPPDYNALFPKAAMPGNVDRQQHRGHGGDTGIPGSQGVNVGGNVMNQGDGSGTGSANLETVTVDR